MGKNKLIIYSGGMDSTVLLNEYKDSIGLAVSFNYGSKHNAREISSAESNCRDLGIKHIVINLGEVTKHFKSDLLKSGGDIPHGHYAADNMKKTVVPFRNGIMLSIAAGIAESNGLGVVMIDNHFGDHDIYPDCRVDFIKSMNAAVTLGTWDKITISSPYKSISKRDIALIGKKIGVDFSKTYSCYEGEDIHCGKCGTCVERLEALDGFDNTEYKDNQYWKGIVNGN